jgi:hypothetical protein
MQNIRGIEIMNLSGNRKAGRILETVLTIRLGGESITKFVVTVSSIPHQ